MRLNVDTSLYFLPSHKSINIGEMKFVIITNSQYHIDTYVHNKA